MASTLFIQFLTKQLLRNICYSSGKAFGFLLCISFSDVQFTLKLKRHLAQKIMRKYLKNRHRGATGRKAKLIRSLDEITLQFDCAQQDTFVLLCFNFLK